MAACLWMIFSFIVSYLHGLCVHHYDLFCDLSRNPVPHLVFCKRNAVMRMVSCDPLSFCIYITKVVSFCNRLCRSLFSIYFVMFQFWQSISLNRRLVKFPLFLSLLWVNYRIGLHSSIAWMICSLADVFISLYQCSFL